MDLRLLVEYQLQAQQAQGSWVDEGLFTGTVYEEPISVCLVEVGAPLRLPARGQAHAWIWAVTPDEAMSRYGYLHDRGVHPHLLVALDPWIRYGVWTPPRMSPRPRLDASSEVILDAVSG